MFIVPFSFRIAPRAKTSASKKTENDASSSAPVPDRSSESKSSDFANSQVQVDELEKAMERVISLVDQGRAGEFGARCDAILGFSPSSRNVAARVLKAKHRRLRIPYQSFGSSATPIAN
ncbi:uncharacterized protein A4U43_UnF4370 [Asparagus officinalis]|uniref:Uncharacterized protein n=1 Tax=Asparagus officinalis TaxID=4686 RepID=A0A1R3L6W6_ASPOF|nr:uncharacterized protein A4U43_UnF4370 [Asparagus officinalis]